MKYLIRTAVALLVLVVVVFGGVALLSRWEAANFVAAGPAVVETTVVIKPGTNLENIAFQLGDAKVVSSEWWFRVGVIARRQASALKAGEYAFPAHASMAEVLDMLVRHKVVQHKVTIAEGLTSDMAVTLVDADPVLEGKATVQPEGSLLPETYLFERGTTRAELLSRMHKAQEKVLAELWPKRKEGLPFKTQEEALTLASIVEKETSLPAERPHIAAVFINRLRIGMKLESDPTIIYGLTKGVALGHPIRQSELAQPNPYSTYQIPGLPPTPICNPGKSAIAAVLDPADSDDMFFVANGTGGHSFAKTEAEHEKNVAQWRKVEAVGAH